MHTVSVLFDATYRYPNSDSDIFEFLQSFPPVPSRFKSTPNNRRRGDELETLVGLW